MTHPNQRIVPGRLLVKDHAGAEFELNSEYAV
jgi:hypothetical protein